MWFKKKKEEIIETVESKKQVIAEYYILDIISQLNDRDLVFDKDDNSNRINKFAIKLNCNKEIRFAFKTEDVNKETLYNFYQGILSNEDKDESIIYEYDLRYRARGDRDREIGHNSYDEYLISGTIFINKFQITNDEREILWIKNSKRETLHIKNYILNYL